MLFDELTRYLNETVRPLLANQFPKNDYIVDLAVELGKSYGPESVLQDKSIPKEAIKKMWVVEVNPFFETTDGCLFSWNQDLDSILNSSVKEPVFKLRRAPSKGASSLIYGIWKDILNEV